MAIGNTKPKIHGLHTSAYILVRKENIQINNVCSMTYAIEKYVQIMKVKRRKMS